MRTGGPLDDEADESRAVWAGVVPLALTAGAPEPSADLRDGVALPDYVEAWRPDERTRRGGPAPHP